MSQMVEFVGVGPDPGPDLNDLDHDFPEAPEEVDFGDLERVDPPVIPNEMEAERHLKAVSYSRREMRRIRDHAAAHRAQIDAWETARLKPIEARLSWYERGLRTWFALVGRKSLKLVYGTLKTVVGRERVEIVAPEIFFARAKAEHPELIRTKTTEEADKVAIGVFIKATGEIPPGCDLVRSEDVVKIDVA